jgi:hypothetical protein
MGGTRKVSVLLDVSQNSVWGWTIGRRKPKPIFVKKIVKLAKGKLSPEDVLCAC